jgi:hypothetical protein
VHSRLLGLPTCGLITEAELRAAEQWLVWTEQTAAPVTSSWQVRVDGGAHAGREPRTGAAQRCREVAAALGASDPLERVDCDKGNTRLRSISEN